MDCAKLGKEKTTPIKPKTIFFIANYCSGEKFHNSDFDPRRHL